jgi:hypothetical protein
MATEQLEVAEPTSDQANGHATDVDEDLAEPIVLEEPSERETVPRFGDPRDAVVTIVRDRLERMLQPVDDDPVWHGVNVITAKDLNAAAAEDLPPASIFAASVRTPAYIYVDAVCPVCGIAGEILLTVDAKLVAVGGSRKLQLAAKATALPHVCGQKRLELGGPSRPAKGQTSLDLGDEDDVNEGGLDPDVDDGTSPSDDSDLETTDRDAIHALAGAKAVEPDDIAELPF